jgi:hypothetical protein
MSEIEDDDGNPINQGSVLSSLKSTYVVDDLLGEGNFQNFLNIH